MFLETRPIETVYLRGSIIDNGLSHIQNRGSFYAYYDDNKNIKGIALLGHFILIESDDDIATKGLAHFARTVSSPRLIRGETDTVEKFWASYSRNKTDAPRLRNRELFLVHRSHTKPSHIEQQVRPATINDLHLIADINAKMICEEGGDNPLEIDPTGFRKRLVSRIKKGRVWVLREGNSLIFKADVLAQTPESIYVEGIYVAPEYRRQGMGSKCLIQMESILLSQSDSISLTVNTENETAIEFYKKNGYEFHCDITTIYLHRSKVSSAAA